MSSSASMGPDLWVEAEGSGGPQHQHQHQHQQHPPASSHQEQQIDRQMLRHLMTKYTAKNLDRLIQEENSSIFSQIDTTSVLTSSTYSPVKSDDVLGKFETASSISNASARTAKLLSRKSHSGSTSSIPQPGSQVQPTESPPISSSLSQGEADSTAAAKQKATFMCGFCKEGAIQKTCTRKNDLKRHIEDFHNTNAQWFCRQRGCGMAFDWQTAYKAHLKHAHGGSRMALGDAKVALCPQTVFGCGFSNCIQVFESPSDADAPTTFKEYVAHVVKHVDESPSSGEWTYSTRIRNLMRQSGVLRAGTNSPWPEAKKEHLTWQPQTSGTLRKCLETRHLGDLRLLMEYAVALGSNSDGIRELQGGFTIPVRDDCQAQIPGHKTRLQPPRQPRAQAATPEPESLQLEVSRGNWTNQSLSNYHSSQCHMEAVRPGGRSSRSTRPPAHTTTMLQSSMMPRICFQPLAPVPSVFDRSGMYQQPGPNLHNQQQQRYPLMGSPDGGIIADDLRSLRSMASGADLDTADVDTADTEMMDSPGYLQRQQGFSALCAPGAPSDGCMGQQSHGPRTGTRVSTLYTGADLTGFARIPTL